MEIKQLPITEDPSGEIYNPNEKEREVVSAVISRFRESQSDRDRTFEYFDGDTLIDYINDSVRRFTTNVDEREDIEDWQARIHDPFTRNKVLAILSKVVRVLPIAQFISQGDDDVRKAYILSNLYDFSEDIDDYEELMIYLLLEAIVKGTAIGYEGVDRSSKKVRDIIKGSDDSMTLRVNTITTNRPIGAIVKLEDFYPSSVSIRNIKLMPYCFWRSVIQFSEFREKWSMYEKSKFVQPKRTYAEGEQEPFYNTMLSSDIKEGQVEIIRYYNKVDDEYIILANGTWINPIAISNTSGTIEGMEMEISPLPFNHKELPFWDIKFDFFGSDFFYGKSLPDRLKSLQDVLNVLNNMLLDQSFLTIFAPILTAGFDAIEDDYLRPGRRTSVDTQGQPLNQSVMKLDLGTPSGWHQYILEYTRKIMEQSSVDQVSSGQAGVGDRTTAQEIRIAADAVASTLGLFGRVVNYGLKRKATLRGANILQIWTDPTTPHIQRLLGQDGAEEVNKAFNVFKINNTVLTSGKRGTKIIELYADKEDMPKKDELKARALIDEANTGKKIEITALPPDYIRNFMFDVKIVPNQKTETSKDLEKALQLEKVRIYKSFFPNLINDPELAAQTAEKMGDDPTKIFLPEPMGWTPKEENPELESPMSMTPQDNAANNAIRGAQGGEGDAMQMRDLANSMLG